MSWDYVSPIETISENPQKLMTFETKQTGQGTSIVFTGSRRTYRCRQIGPRQAGKREQDLTRLHWWSHSEHDQERNDPQYESTQSAAVNWPLEQKLQGATSYPVDANREGSPSFYDSIPFNALLTVALSYRISIYFRLPFTTTPLVGRFLFSLHYPIGRSVDACQKEHSMSHVTVL